MYTGLADQEALAKTDFLTNPRALVGVVLDGVKGGDARVKLLGEIAARYMETYLDADPPKLPLTPHHTQIVAMLIFSQFYEQREACAARGVRAAILQMATGEVRPLQFPTPPRPSPALLSSHALTALAPSSRLLRRASRS